MRVSLFIEEMGRTRQVLSAFLKVDSDEADLINMFRYGAPKYRSNE